MKKWLIRTSITLLALVICLVGQGVNTASAAAANICFISGFETGATVEYDSVQGSPAVLSEAECLPLGEQYWDIENNGGVVNSSTSQAQTFTTSSSYDIYSVTLKTYRTSGVTGSVDIGIYATSSGEPTGSELTGTTADVTFWITSTGGQYYSFIFDSPYTLSASTVYAIVVSDNSLTGNAFWRFDTNGTYTGGAMYQDTGSGWTESTGDDHTFSTNSPLPNTSQALLECDTTSTQAYVEASTDTDIISFSVYMYIADLPSADTLILGNTNDTYIVLTTTGEIDVYDSVSGKVADGTTQLDLYTWHRLNSRMDVTGNYTYIWIDGVVEHSSVNVDGTDDQYNDSTSSYGFRVGVGTSCTARIYFDDIVLSDDYEGTVSYIDDYRVGYLSLSGTLGTDQNIGSGVDWQKYDSTPASAAMLYQRPITETTLYDWAEADGGMMRLSANVEDTSAIEADEDLTIDTISAVEWQWYYETGGGGANYNYIQYDQSYRTEVAIGDPKTPTFLSALELDAPSDGDAWTATLVNGIEIGMSTDDANKDLYWYNSAVQIAFIPQAGATPDISNTPSSKDFGVVAESSTYWANGSTPSWPLTDGDAYFTVTNNSGAAVDIQIKATNFTGGVGWTISSSTGSNIVVLTAFEEGDGSGDGLVLTTSYQDFILSLADSADKDWEIKLETGTFTDGAEKTSTITLSASLA